jgi:uncharacterized protein (DUF2252 family)
MVFDGQSSVITISQPIPPMPAGVTIEFWALGGDDLPRATSIFAAWKADGARVLNIHFPWSDGVIYWDAGSDGWDRIHHAAEPGEYKTAWTHWAFVKDVAAGEMAIYRDGVLWHKDGGRTNPLTDGALAIIGAYIGENYKWAGRLAEFRIWDRARTAEEIAGGRSQRLTGTEPGLVGYWPLGQIDGSDATPDLTGNRPGDVKGATIVPDDALAAALASLAAPGPAPVSGNGTLAPSAGPVDTPDVGPTDSVLVTILRYNEGRKRRLVRLKLKRMASDPFAFFRGTDHLYAAAWPELRPPDAGPNIPICGDLHLENFGAYHTDDGELLYDINDFDEAVVGPCSLDLVRCATSILLAAELWQLTPLQASGMVLAYLDTYRRTVIGTDHKWALDARAPRLAKGPVWEILGKCALADQASLLDQHTERHRNGTRRLIRSKNRHPSIKLERANEIAAAVEAYGARKGRVEFFKTLDVAGRVAGIGSLGVARYTVLVNGGGSARTNRLFDLKACRPSALRSCTDRPWPFPDESEAARVVRAQRILQAWPTAGLDVVTVGETVYRFRELIPEENRSSLGRFNKKPEKLRVAIEEAGLLTALAHRRAAEVSPDGGAIDALARWASGAALDSVLAGAARFAEHSRIAYIQFRAEMRSPGALPARLRKQYCR